MVQVTIKPMGSLKNVDMLQLRPCESGKRSDKGQPETQLTCSIEARFILKGDYDNHSGKSA